MANSFPEDVLEHVFSFIQRDKDRNAVSLVCKAWYELERWSRKQIFVGNCYAVRPEAVIRRFPDLRSVSLKGKPHFADYNLVPEGWGGYLHPWIAVFSGACPQLEELRLKRMVVTDDSLEIISRSFPNFKVLVLSSCEGFSADGLSAIALNCRNLQELDLRESELEDSGKNCGYWLNDFQDSHTSLVSLNISCLASELNFSVLESLIGRSPNLSALKLCRAVPLDRLLGLLRLAPGLVELGTGSFSADLHPVFFSRLEETFSQCRNLQSLSGFWDVVPAYLPSLYSVCSGITFLNLSDAVIPNPNLTELVTLCQNLQRLWVFDYIEDSGLEALSRSCKDLQELRVFPSEPYEAVPNVNLTEQGLLSVSEGCPKLSSVLYFCRQMSNAALITVARNCPGMTRFRLAIIEPHTSDYLTMEPFDVGFGAIVRYCPELQRLSMSGFLTDLVFEYIGLHAKKLEMLSIAFAGESDTGLHHVLSGCGSLRKLEIRDCPFGDNALLANAAKLETMRSLWMSSCLVSFGACKQLSRMMPRLNVEVMNERGPLLEERPDNCPVEKLYIYRTVAGRRIDKPPFVWTMDEDDSQLGLS